MWRGSGGCIGYTRYGVYRRIDERLASGFPDYSAARPVAAKCYSNRRSRTHTRRPREFFSRSGREASAAYQRWLARLFALFSLLFSRCREAREPIDSTHRKSTLSPRRRELGARRCARAFSRACPLFSPFFFLFSFFFLSCFRCEAQTEARSSSRIERRRGYFRVRPDRRNVERRNFCFSPSRSRQRERASAAAEEAAHSEVKSECASVCSKRRTRKRGRRSGRRADGNPFTARKV